ncbi:hypothetical protein Ahy_B09g096101 isoform B [Arachis hypogaea]|uniref:SWIM-type domain-containing protein n=1 Tax=Arachis hypogaea TaxID=3818 RepID=A0A444XII6_ARAHY|nr:hypothetical protein Ahy_B09g096101 isoform B [Arachis hypogaea]
MAMAQYSSTAEDWLGSLFWADGICRADYQHFGDVFAFHATYKKNKYKKPLKNATLKIKDPGLCESFKKFIYAKWDLDEFEEEWSKLVEEFGGINHFIKRFVHSRHSILEFVENLERALRDYRNNEMVVQFKIINSDHVLTTNLQSLELCDVNIYTREIFKLVRKQIEEVVSLDIIHSKPLSTTMVYKICAFQKRVKIFTVVYDRNEKKLECECCHWDHEGYPCSHMLCVLRREDVDELPESIILKRRTRDAKKYTNDQTVESTTNDAEKGFLMRYDAMSVATMWMSFLAAQEVPLFADTMNEVTRWTKNLEKRCSIKRQNEVADVLHPAAEFVGDPCVAKTKGAPKIKKNETRKMSCSNCFVKGHTKRHCPKLADEGDRAMIISLLDVQTQMRQKKSLFVPLGVRIMVETILQSLVLSSWVLHRI